MSDEQFFSEIRELVLKIEELVDEHDMRDRVMSLFIMGVLDHDIFGDTKLKALFSYNIQTAGELNELVDFAYNTWSLPDEDEINSAIDDLLDGLDIDLKE